jgi:hypothetical protein
MKKRIPLSNLRRRAIAARWSDERDPAEPLSAEQATQPDPSPHVTFNPDYTAKGPGVSRPVKSHKKALWVHPAAERELAPRLSKISLSIPPWELKRPNG